MAQASGSRFGLRTSGQQARRQGLSPLPGRPQLWQPCRAPALPHPSCARVAGAVTHHTRPRGSRQRARAATAAAAAALQCANACFCVCRRMLVKAATCVVVRASFQFLTAVCNSLCARVHGILQRKGAPNPHDQSLIPTRRRIACPRQLLALAGAGLRHSVLTVSVRPGPVRLTLVMPGRRDTAEAAAAAVQHSGRSAIGVREAQWGFRRRAPHYHHPTTTTAAQQQQQPPQHNTTQPHPGR